MFDILIIGAGIVGTTIARGLSKYKLKTVVLDKESDVANQATMANSAIVHSGHDPIPNSLKAKFNIRGNELFEQMCDDLDIPFIRTGGLVVAVTKEQQDELKNIYSRAIENGLNKISLLSREEALEKEPNLSSHVLAALSLPTTAVTYPYEAAIANMENAMDNGVELYLDNEVIKIEKKDDYFILTTSKNDIYKAKVIINAAGVHADKIYGLVDREFDWHIKPRRGEYFILDKDTKGLVKQVIYPTPTDKGKGVLITPMVHGNMLIGPNSEFGEDKEGTHTTQSGLNYIREHISKTIENVPFHKVIRSFTGLRASGSTKDFIIEESRKVSKFINVAAIESPGLTAAPAIAEYVVEKLVSKHLNLIKKENYLKNRREIINLIEMSFEERNKMISKDKSFGNIVCKCEQISEGEIVDRIHRNAGAKTVKAVKKRTRAGHGRCQGEFCQSQVVKILARELNQKPMDIKYDGKNSNIFLKRTKV